ncbi:unnamed protein product [Diplocarpon coronariae]
METASPARKKLVMNGRSCSIRFRKSTRASPAGQTTAPRERAVDEMQGAPAALLSAHTRDILRRSYRGQPDLKIESAQTAGVDSGGRRGFSSGEHFVAGPIARAREDLAPGKPAGHISWS